MSAVLDTVQWQYNTKHPLFTRELCPDHVRSFFLFHDTTKPVLSGNEI